jgi:DNA processing protein
VPAELADLPPGFPDGFGQGPDDRRAVMLLSGLRGTSPAKLRVLAWQEGSATACVEAIASGSAGTDNDRAYLAGVDPEVQRGALDVAGARFVVPGDPEYWPAFRRLVDPPVGVYLRGGTLGLGEERVAIVGARTPTRLGLDVAGELARGVALAGVAVVSGGALGIDAASHRGALAVGGRTVAVLGSGIDVLHPSHNRRLFRSILDGGGTIASEYPPGVPAERRRFPARNRLIAALSRGVVVVEGRERSGTRITADHATDLGLDVFAVPGPVTSPLSATPLALLRDGATMIRDAADLLGELGRDPSAPPAALSLPDDERSVLDALTAPSLPETLARKLRMSSGEVLATLIRLELRGIVRSVGGRFERTIRVGAA